MAYTKTNWISRIRQYAHRIVLNATGGTDEYDVDLVEGTISENGTPFDTANMNNIEDGIGNVLNPEFISIDTNQSINSLTDSTKGTLDIEKIEGRTLVSKLINGNFDDGTNGWNTQNSILTVEENYLKVESDNNHLYRIVKNTPDIKITSEHKYFGYCKIKTAATTSKLCFYFYTNGTSQHFSDEDLIPGEKYYYGTITSTETGNSNMRLGVDDAYQNEFYINRKAGVMIIDMTELGIENYTDEQMLIILKHGYFEGVHSAKDIELKNVGENLFDKSKALYNKGIYYTNGNLFSIEDVYATDYIKIESNINYYLTINNFSSSYAGIAFYTNNKIFLSGISTTNSFMTPDDAYYIRFTIPQEGNATWPNTTDIDIVQFQKGETATEYTPYQESIDNISYPNSFTEDDKEMRSLSSDITDIVRKIADNENEFVKIVEKLILDIPNDWIYNYSKTGVKRVGTYSIPNYKSHYDASFFKYDLTHLAVGGTEQNTGDFYTFEDDYKLFIMVNATDSGWGDDYTPISDEIRAYFLGWRMVIQGSTDIYNGIGTKAWVRIIDNSNETTTLPTITYEGYTPYQLFYQLIEEQVYKLDKSIGLSTFDDGAFYMDGDILPIITGNYSINKAGQTDSNSNGIQSIYTETNTIQNTLLTHDNDIDINRDDISLHTENNVIHVVQGDKDNWNGKLDADAKAVDSDKLDNHDSTYFEPTLATDQKRKITDGTADPSGGADGDIYLQYE